jgi:DNA-binding transcriptional LysR family regulator
MLERKRTAPADWTDLQYVVELARKGSLSSAARALGVTHATVARRIAALESRLGRPLFERRNGTFVPTGFGAEVVSQASRMEEAALHIARVMAGAGLDIAGPVRVTATDMVASNLLAPVLAQLQRTHPGLDIDLIVSRENLSLARRDADIALRLGRPEQGDLVRRKLAEIGYFRYASRSYVAAHAPDDYAYIAYSHNSLALPEVQAFDEHYANTPVALRTNHLGARRAAVSAGLGVGLLPKLIAEPDSELVRLDEEPTVLRQLWLVVHSDMRSVPRIRTCFEAIGRAIIAEQPRML